MAVGVFVFLSSTFLKSLYRSSNYGKTKAKLEYSAFLCIHYWANNYKTLILFIILMLEFEPSTPDIWSSTELQPLIKDRLL